MRRQTEVKLFIQSASCGSSRTSMMHKNGSFGRLFTKCESQGGIGGPRTRSVHITDWLSWMREEPSEFKNSLEAPAPWHGVILGQRLSQYMVVFQGKNRETSTPPTPCLPSICILSIILLLLAMWVHVWICACGYVHVSAGVQAVSPWSWTCWEPGPLDEQHGLLDFYILFI